VTTSAGIVPYGMPKHNIILVSQPARSPGTAAPSLTVGRLTVDEDFTFGPL
jgi:hypothetical protein